jgi:hypothetical protein
MKLEPKESQQTLRKVEIRRQFALVEQALRAENWTSLHFQSKALAALCKDFSPETSNDTANGGKRKAT